MVGGVEVGCVFCNRFRVVVGHVNGNWTGQNKWYAIDGNNNGGGCWVVRQEQWRVKQKEKDIQQLFDHLLQVVVGKVFAKFLVEIGQSAFLYSTSKIGFKYCKRGFHIIDLLRFKSWNG